jgi:nucleotide-binding universal stress UspA family protein
VVDEIAGDPDIQAREARDRIRALMPESLKSQAFIDVRFGEVGEALLQMAAEIDPLFMVMPAHRKGFLSRLMSGDRAFEVLHGSPCPVCFVPPAAQTAT